MLDNVLKRTTQWHLAKGSGLALSAKDKFLKHIYICLMIWRKRKLQKILNVLAMKMNKLPVKGALLSENYWVDIGHFLVAH